MIVPGTPDIREFVQTSFYLRAARSVFRRDPFDGYGLFFLSHGSRNLILPKIACQRNPEPADFKVRYLV